MNVLADKVLISVDVEADGPIPGPYSMLSVGACLVTEPDVGFYRELQPISDNVVPKALAVSGLDRDVLAVEGATPRSAMQSFEDWLREVSPGRQPLFCAYPLTFDWKFTDWYFHNFLERNPFGITGFDFRSAYFGSKQGEVSWDKTIKRFLPKNLRSERFHTHHALDDAREQADLIRHFLQHLAS